jgi:hypothetical protein
MGGLLARVVYRRADERKVATVDGDPIGGKVSNGTLADRIEDVLAVHLTVL